MKNAKRTVLTVSLTAVFSATAWADNQQIAERVALSDDNQTQIQDSSVHHDEEIATKSTTDNTRNNSDSKKETGKLKDNLAVDQSFDLNGNAESISEDSGKLKDDHTPVAVTANAANATELESITVTGTRKKTPNEAYHSSFDRKTLQNSVKGKGDIGTMLKSLPNVQFDNANDTSMRAGEISPSKISISGGQHYQNSFIVDGINFNNDLDPATENFAQNPNQLRNAGSGRSQGLALDVNMLESIKVIDSNADASYGEFTGGVIEAEIRRPEKDFGFEIKHRFTNGSVAKGFPKSLTQYHVDYEGDKADLLMRDGNVYTYYDTPEFTKNKTTITVEGRPTEKLGIIGQFQKFESKMPIQLNTVDITGETGYKAPTPYDTPEKFGQRRNREQTQYNAFIKAFYDVNDDLNMDFTYTYSPDYDKRFMAGSDGSYYTTDHGGHALGWTTKWNNPLGRLKNTLSFSHLQDTKTAHGYSDIYRFAMISDRDHWGREEEGQVKGGPVPSEKTQTTFTESLRQDFKPFNLGNTTHNISAGFDVTLQKAKFGYTNDFYREDTNNAVPMTYEEQQKCLQNGDQRWCDPSRTYDVGWLGVNKGFLPTNPMFETEEFINPWTGEPVGANNYFQYGALSDKMLIWKYGNYVQKVRHYDSSRQTKVNNTKADIWLSDNIEIPLGKEEQYGKLTLTPGVRLDWEELNNNKNFAHRFSADYAFPWKNSKPEYETHFTFGTNRYYGRSFYNSVFKDGMNTLETILYRRSPDVAWADVLNGPECSGTEPLNYENGKKPGSVKYGIDANGNKTYSCKETTPDSSSRWTQLKTPYSDEFMFGLTQQLGAFKFTGKYIRRNGRNEVVASSRKVEDAPELEGYSSNYTIFTNGGKSKTDIISLKLENENPIKFWGIDHKFSLAADWTNTKRNKIDYNDSMDADEKEDLYILVDGKLTKWSERPANNFLKPYSIKLSTQHDWKMLGGDWHLSNLFRFTAPFKTYATSSREDLPGSQFGLKQPTVPQYRPFKFPSKFTWDMAIGAEYKVYGKNTLFFNVEVDNLLNKRYKSTASQSYDRNTGTWNETEVNFDTGRSIWLELGYRF